MNESQIEIIKSITNEMVQVYQDMLFDEETVKEVGNMYVEIVASILSSVNMTIINGFARDVSEDAAQYKQAMIELSEIIVRDLMGSVAHKIKQMEMH